MKLTDVQIKKAKLKAKPYKMTDGGGLFLWVTPAGGRLWRWSYWHEGKQKLMSLGRYPDVTLARARERHSEARSLLADGVDPMAQRKAVKTAERIASENSFKSVTDQWMEHWRDGKSLRHVDSTRRRLDANILPTLGALPMDEIEAVDVVRMVKAIEKRGARDIAKRAMETTGQIFRYAIAHGYAKRNPAIEVRPSDILKSAAKTNHARVDEKELPALLRQIEVYPGTHVTRLAIKLIALTFVRTRELIEAEWTEFNLDRARWDIPASRMKMRTPHIVPLSRQAVELLRILHELTGDGKLVFPGDRNPKKPMSNNTILQGLARMGYKGQMTGHGFRGVASTILHEQGYLHDHIELQLAHAPRNAVSAAYNHALYLEPRTKMMQEWADFLDAARRDTKVLHFRGQVA